MTTPSKKTVQEEVLEKMVAARDSLKATRDNIATQLKEIDEQIAECDRMLDEFRAKCAS